MRDGVHQVGFAQTNAAIKKQGVEGYRTAFCHTAGGGMGRSHGNEATYPRMADVIGFITPEQLIPAAKAVLTLDLFLVSQ